MTINIKPDSFHRLPISDYKRILNPITGKIVTYSLWPAMQIRTSLPNYYPDAQPSETPYMIRVAYTFYQLISQLIVGGILFRGMYSNNKSIIYGTGFKRHEVYQIKNEEEGGALYIFETTPNGEVFINVKKRRHIELTMPLAQYYRHLYTPNYVIVDSKNHKNYTRLTLDQAGYEIPRTNQMGTEARIFPDLGGTIT